MTRNWSDYRPLFSDKTVGIDPGVPDLPGLVQKPRAFADPELAELQDIADLVLIVKSETNDKK